MPPFFLDSVTHLRAEHRGCAALCASHGGLYAGHYAAKIGVGAVILNDAGIGRDDAGIAGVRLLDRLGVPAAAIAHTSARIGDGGDGMRRGVLSFVNAVAVSFGLGPGMSCADALLCLANASLVPAPAPPELDEARSELVNAGASGIRVILIDSNALVTPADVGQIIVTGSHGGLLGGRPETAVRYDVRAAVYNDAGIGIDSAGVSRLPALDDRGIAGACVSAASARIGDARSTYGDGIVSALNRIAGERGGAVGQTCRAFVAAMVGSGAKP